MRFALALTRRFWDLRAHPLLQDLRRSPDRFVVNHSDCYCNLRLAAIQAGCRFRRDIHGDLARYIWWALRAELKKELRRSAWWLDDDGIARIRAHQAAGTTPTADLLVPRYLSELTDPNLHTLTHLLDDLPDEATARSPHDEVCLGIQREQLHVLLKRLPKHCRGPVWLVHALGWDYYTAGRQLGVPALETWEWATEGLERLQALVKRDPGCLLPP